MKVHYRILSLMVLLSLVLSTVSPVLAQDGLPGGQPLPAQTTGPVPVPAGTVIGPQTAAGDMASPSQTGLLFLHRYAPIGRESDHLLLAPPFVAAEGLELVADRTLAMVDESIALTATITNSVNSVNEHTLWFSDGNFTAELNGDNEVPPVVTSASGLATFEVDFATGVTHYTLDATGLISPTMAHIHVGAAGVNGGPIHWLFHSTGANAPSTLPATGVITFTQAQINILLEEGLYVNVHTPAHTGGEIRGQITGAEKTYTDANGQSTTTATSTIPVQKTMYALSDGLMDSVHLTFTQEYTITVSADPVAGGTASGGGTVYHFDTITVTATANTGYNFVNWTEGGNPVSTNASFSFMADGDRTLVANFVLKSYTITISADPVDGGTVSGGGTVTHGDMVTVTATANTGYDFVNWTEAGNPVSTDTSFSFTADGDRTLVANFVLKSYTIAVSASPVAGGTAGGGGTVYHFDTVTVTATANTGYDFVNWTEAGNPVSTDTSFSFTADGDRTLVANFALKSYTIAVSADPAAGGTAGGGGTVNHGVMVTVTATANTGYNFVNWTEGGSSVSTDASFSFTADGDRTLVANFALKSYTIAVSADPVAGGTAGGGGVVTHGDMVTVTATANTGYTFVNWKVAGIIVSSNPTYVFTATEDRTLVASFALLDVPQYSISLSAEPADGGTVSGGGTVQQGETVTVTATANTGYTFVNWTEDGNEVSTDASFSFTADGDRSLVANFAMIIQVMNMSVSREPAEIMLGESVTITAIVTGSNGLPMAGEIVLATDGILTAQLSGANEVPPNTSTATGLARFVVDPTTYNPIANTLSVNYTLAVEGLENFTAAHIHRGGPGVNGPVAYPLQLGGGSFTMNAVDLVPLLTGQLYVNVHTQGIPAGEIRGQIEGAGMGITDANGVATISFIPHYAGTVTIYVAPLSNPIALLRNVTVTVNTPPSMLYLPVISK